MGNAQNRQVATINRHEEIRNYLAALKPGDRVSLLAEKNFRSHIHNMEFSSAEVITSSANNLAIRSFKSQDRDHDHPWCGKGEVDEERVDFKPSEIMRIVKLV